jgi:hypothetical protein
VTDFLNAAQFAAIFSVPVGLLVGLLIFGSLRLMRRGRHGLAPVRWQRDAKIGGLFGTGALAAVGIAFVGIGMMFGGMFGHGVPHVTMSPDGQHQALVFEGDSGAMDHSHIYLSVLPKDKQLGEHEAGNAFAVDGNQIISVRWTDSVHLRVEYPAQADENVFLRKKSVGGVYIEYVGVH